MMALVGATSLPAIALCALAISTLAAKLPLAEDQVHRRRQAGAMSIVIHPRVLLSIVPAVSGVQIAAARHACVLDVSGGRSKEDNRCWTIPRHASRCNAPSELSQLFLRPLRTVRRSGRVHKQHL